MLQRCEKGTEKTFFPECAVDDTSSSVKFRFCTFQNDNINALTRELKKWENDVAALKTEQQSVREELQQAKDREDQSKDLEEKYSELQTDFIQLQKEVCCSLSFCKPV